MYQSSDVLAAQSRTTGSETSIPTLSGDTGSGLATGTKVGIAVGTSLGILALIMIGSLFLLRRKRRKNALMNEQEAFAKPELEALPTKLPTELVDAARLELEQSARPELDSLARPAELAGDDVPELQARR